MDIDNLFKSFEENDDFLMEVKVGEEPIVFISDFLHNSNGQVYEFSEDAYKIFTSTLDKSSIPQDKYQIIPAVRRSGLREEDISTVELAKHREVLYASIDEIKPSLIIPLGNFAMKAILKKSGITNKRGKEFMVDMDGEGIPVVPTYHPTAVYLEPRLRSLFRQDLDNAYDKFILNINKLNSSNYVMLDTVDKVREYVSMSLGKSVVAVDLETTGLDFKKDKITTLGMSSGEGTAAVIPVYHKDTPFLDSELSEIREMVSELMKTDTTAKVFHNCKFDLKFLMNWGITEFKNIDDTKLMHTLINENLPHGLMDLVKQYFPNELEKY